MASDSVITGNNRGSELNKIVFVSSNNIYIYCNKEQVINYLDYFVKNKKCNWELLIWGKKNPPPFTCGHYLKDKEYCLLFWESGAKINGTYKTLRTVYLTDLNTEDKKNYQHPTIKPIEMVKNLIINSTCENALVLDPFSGSGTTAAACKETNRNFIGFEINEEYYKKSIDRLNGVNQKDLFNQVEQLDLFEGKVEK